LSLYHANEQGGKNVTRLLAEMVLPTLRSIKVEDLPILGFFVFCGIQFDLNIPIPSHYEIAEQITKDLTLSELVFCICFLKKYNKLLEKFSNELSRYIFLRNVKFSINEMTGKYPFETTRQLIIEILNGFDLPKEPDSTFAEMICLTKSYSKEKGRAAVAFSQLRDYFLNNPVNDPLFTSVDVSAKWLAIAIEHGIFRERQVPHYKDPSGIVTLLSLNAENDTVSLYLREDET
jgi:hypothetical protein